MEKTGQKGLTLKIAAGVFVGIMAALLVYSIPGWIRQHEVEQRVHENLEREWWIEQMTPEQFPARCGKLLKDESFREVLSAGVKVTYGSKLSARDVTVEVTNVSGKREPVSAEYLNIAEAGEAPNWNLTTISIYRVFDDRDRDMLTDLYPCLRKPSP
jgi:hypothetical protein